MLVLKNETRPDIALELKRDVLLGGTSFISPILFPVATVTETANAISVAQIVTGTATVNRTHGDTLTGAHKVSKKVSYDLQKIEDRTTLDETDVKTHGGEDNAIKAAALVSGRTVLMSMEVASAAIVFSTAKYNAAQALTTDAPWKGIADAARSVKRFGQPYLVCSESWLTNFVSIPKVADQLLAIFGDRIIGDLLAGVETAMNSVGLVFGVKGILVGEDDAWVVAGKEDAAAIVAIRPESQGNPIATAKALPSYGIGPTFLPDPANADTLIQIITGWNTSNNTNVVDALAFYEPLVCNAAGCILVKLPATQS